MGNLDLVVAGSEQGLYVMPFQQSQHAVLYPNARVHTILGTGPDSATAAVPSPAPAHSVPPSSGRPEFPEEFRPEFLELAETEPLLIDVLRVLHDRMDLPSAGVE